jgi:translocation and assembly module TamA
MRRACPPALALPLLALLAGLARPAEAALAKVEVRGVDDALAPALLAATRVGRLDEGQRAALGDARLRWLLRQAPGEVAEALRPYGYYAAEVEVRVEQGRDGAEVVLEVAPGEPVRVRTLEVTVLGEAEADARVQRALRRFRPRVGEVLEHAAYEASKAAVGRRLADQGYFDAEVREARVEVLREARTADVRVAWDSGRRYRFGEARFSGSPFRAGLLDPIPGWTPGEPWEQARLLDLQQSLAGFDWFSAIEVRPLPEEADAEGRVPVEVALVPAKRHVYSVGLGFGTDTGAGVRAGFEQRWVNDRGHKALYELNWAQRRSTLAATYRIPAFDWVDGWWQASAVLRDEDFADDSTLQAFELIAGRSGRLGDWDLTANLNLKRERSEAGGEALLSTLLYPSLLAQRTEADDPITPRRGWSLTAELRAGSDALGSDIAFTQLRGEARLVLSFGRATRLLLRGEAGTTSTADFNRFPLSLRFFAGGDRSLRGYGYREVAPVGVRRIAGEPALTGGRHLLVGSVELERMFTRTWGAAVFVDAGNAFNRWDAIDPVVGVGLGLRWRSPVGPVRIDVAHGLDNREDDWRIHLNIGPDL